MFTAALFKPPYTVERRPLAVFKFPASTLAFTPLAVLESPVTMVAYFPLSVFRRPNTMPPVELKLLKLPGGRIPGQN